MHRSPSERRLALIALVETIAGESGTYAPFDPETWVDMWLDTATPFRDGRRLRDLLKDDEDLD